MNCGARLTFPLWAYLACIACLGGIICQDHNTESHNDATTATQSFKISTSTTLQSSTTTNSLLITKLVRSITSSKPPSSVATHRPPIKTQKPADPSDNSDSGGGNSVFTIAISQAVILMIILIFYATYRLCKNPSVSTSNSTSQVQTISGNRANVNSAENGTVYGDIPPSYSFCLENGVINGSNEEDPPSYNLALRLKQGLPIVLEEEVASDSLNDSSSNIENGVNNTSTTSLSSEETVSETRTG